MMETLGIASLPVAPGNGNGNGEVYDRSLELREMPLPQALTLLGVELSRLAGSMAPDDISLNVDLSSGVMSFRAYRRQRIGQ